MKGLESDAGPTAVNSCNCMNLSGIAGLLREKRIFAVNSWVDVVGSNLSLQPEYI